MQLKLKLRTAFIIIIYFFLWYLKDRFAFLSKHVELELGVMLIQNFFYNTLDSFSLCEILFMLV